MKSDSIQSQKKKPKPKIPYNKYGLQRKSKNNCKYQNL